MAKKQLVRVKVNGRDREVEVEPFCGRPSPQAKS